MIFFKDFFSFQELEVTSTRYGAGPVESGVGFGQNASNSMIKQNSKTRQ